MSAPEVLVVNCENCNAPFEICRHKRSYIQIPGGTQLVLVCGTGKNMVYKGSMNREYAMCPECGTVEHQFSAEARDQADELGFVFVSSVPAHT